MPTSKTAPKATGTARKASGTVTPSPVALLGTGPGDPDLLTVRAADTLATADVVLAAPGVPRAVLEGLSAEVLEAPSDELPDPAKEAAARAKGGQRVVRALPGDPFFYPELSREVTALGRAKVGFEIVPGVAPAAGVPAYAGIPLGLPQTVAAVDADTDWAALAAAPGSVVLLPPSLAEVGKAAAALVEHGRRGDTPVAVTVAGTTAQQRTIASTLDRVEAELDAWLAEHDEAPATGAVVVVGAAVKQREKFSWWESRALFGWTVLVPRTREQAGTLSEMLRAHGAIPLEVPTIAVEPPRTPAPMERALKGLISGRYAWIAFTSTNAVRAVREKVEEYGLDSRAFAGVKIAAVGEVTAAAIESWGIKPDLVPSGQQSSEGLLADFPPYDDVLDPLDRVFLPRADIATDTLVAGLKELGWAVDDITAYRTVRASPPPAPIREALKGGKVDAVLFTSSSTVRNLVGIAGKPHESTVIAVIGPQTAEAAREAGLRVDVQSPEPSVPALVEALAEFTRQRRAEGVEDGKGTVVPVRGARSRRKR